MNADERHDQTEEFSQENRMNTIHVRNPFSPVHPDKNSILRS